MSAVKRGQLVRDPGQRLALLLAVRLHALGDVAEDVLDRTHVSLAVVSNLGGFQKNLPRSLSPGEGGPCATQVVPDRTIAVRRSCAGLFFLGDEHPGAPQR